MGGMESRLSGSDDKIAKFCLKRINSYEDLPKSYDNSTSDSAGAPVVEATMTAAPFPPPTAAPASSQPSLFNLWNKLK